MTWQERKATGRKFLASTDLNREELKYERKENLS